MICGRRIYFAVATRRRILSVSTLGVCRVALLPSTPRPTLSSRESSSLATLMNRLMVQTLWNTGRMEHERATSAWWD